MKITKSIWVALISVTVCFSQTYNISGIVTDTGTTPIAGALVRLEQAGLAATSGKDGRFTLSGTDGIAVAGELASNRLAVTLQGGLISIALPEPAVVRVQVYSVQGRLISAVQRNLGSGTSTMLCDRLPAGIYLYRVMLGSKEILLKGNSIGLVSKDVTAEGSETPAHLRKSVSPRISTAINDVIKVVKPGYLNFRVVVYDSDTSNIKIKMIANAGDLTDIDGNVYQTVRIGNQVWMVENLRVTRFNDGSAIPLVTDFEEWRHIYDINLATPAYCFYNNTTNSDSIKKYGALYNWHVVSPTNARKIAPAGWHVPTYADWDRLEKYLISKAHNRDYPLIYGIEIAKPLAAQTDWRTDTNAGTIGCDLTLNNQSGFSAFPGGYRYGHGTFDHHSYYGYWWGATEFDETFAFSPYLCYKGAVFFGHYSYKSCGYSVRLLRD